MRATDGTTVAFGGRARWRGTQVHVLLIEERPAEAGILAELIGSTVPTTVIDETGALELATSAGVLVIPADPDYEAWEIRGPGSRLLVSMPGGEIAMWE